MNLTVRRAQDPAETPSVDVLVVSYNGAKWWTGFCESLAELDYPADRLRMVVVDNGSKDGSIDRLRELTPKLPFAVEIVETGVNGGFTGGYRVAFEHAKADYWFVVNQDTRIGVDAVRKLVEVLEEEPKAGMAEARQSPRAHAKYFDPFTRETSWCSGACVLVRAAAMAEVGGFDQDFFMYVEDVDLSWRMWLQGWKCLFVRDAVVEHFTEDLDVDRKPMAQHYFSMRNGALMRVAYGTAWQILVHYLAILHWAFGKNLRWWQRWGAVKAMLASFRCWPGALRKRAQVRRLPESPWVFFNGWDYGRHMIDLSEQPREAVADVRNAEVDTPFEHFRECAANCGSPYVDLESKAFVGGEKKPAILMYKSAELRIPLSPPEHAAFVGAVAAPADQEWPAGRFVVEYNGRELWRFEQQSLQSLHHGWRKFAVPLPVGSAGEPGELVLRFETLNLDPVGYWSDLQILSNPPPADTTKDPDAVRISVIVPTHNRAVSVPRVVRRLLQQEKFALPFEVVVVDSNSSDDTPNVLADLARDPRVRTCRVERKGAAAARNAGLEMARGRLVVMMDDDILIRRDFLARLWREHLQCPDRVLLTRIVAPYDGMVEPFLRYLVAAQEVNLYDFADPDDVSGDYFYTGCVAVPREVLRDVRFDENFTIYGVEDIEFGIRLLSRGAKMTFVRDVEVWHEYYPGADYYVRKRTHSGYSLAYFLEKKPWRKRNYVFQGRYVNHNRKLGLILKCARPAMKLIELWESLRYVDSPVRKWLHKWYHTSIRYGLYGGILLYRNTGGRSEGLPTLGAAAPPPKAEAGGNEQARAA